jgi:hypothetical protein
MVMRRWKCFWGDDGCFWEMRRKSVLKKVFARVEF